MYGNCEIDLCNMSNESIVGEDENGTYNQVH